MNVDVFLTHTAVTENDVRGRAVVVIDVLRTCSTINTALCNGARAVMPVPDMAEAGKIVANLDPDVFRLGGERGDEKIDGYHLGNSPLEYTEEEVEGRDVILNTTNGTKALQRARAARHLVAGSFLNVSRTARFLSAQGLGVTIICAGHENRMSLEDTLCAGALLYRLWNGHEPGHAPGVDYCYRMDCIPVLPPPGDRQRQLLVMQCLSHTVAVIQQDVLGTPYAFGDAMLLEHNPFGDALLVLSRLREAGYEKRATSRLLRGRAPEALPLSSCSAAFVLLISCVLLTKRSHQRLPLFCYRLQFFEGRGTARPASWTRWLTGPARHAIGARRTPPANPRVYLA